MKVCLCFSLFEVNAPQFWTITMPRVCKAALQAGAPVIRAEYTVCKFSACYDLSPNFMQPFEEGFTTLIRGDPAIHLWASNDLNTPAFSFHG